MAKAGEIDIRSQLSEADAKVIFSNRDRGAEFLKRVGVDVSKGASAPEVWAQVSAAWTYERDRPLVRQLFKESAKYRAGCRAEALLPELVKEWKKLKLGDIKWPIGQASFDALTQAVNKLPEGRPEKDRQIEIGAVRFRRMKELVTARNDFIERLIFDANEDLIPTFGHTRKADFFIRGERFDQKVSKSVGRDFKKMFSDEHEKWRAAAIDDPGAVAKSLYENQESDRFSADPRLYVVDVDEAAFDPEQIRSAVEGAVLNDPLEVSFTYQHPGGRARNYDSRCIVVLLLNPELPR